MMSRIYLWFYCLKLSDALFLLIAATWTILLIRRRREALLRILSPAVLVLWLMAVSWATLSSRVGTQPDTDLCLIPFYSYWKVGWGGDPELLRANFMNAVLFYPGGLFLVCLLPEGWSARKQILTAVLLCGVVSASIEVLQALCSLGAAEADDLIHNLLGGVLGALAAHIPIGSLRIVDRGV